MSSDNDFAAFLTEMQDVAPIKPDDRVQLKKQDDSINHSIRQEAAVAKPTIDQNYLSADHVEMVHPLDYLEFRRDGIAHGVFRRLKQGKYNIEARLDLHKKSVEQSRQELFTFIHDCRKYEIRTAIILPGKGERSEVQALLKSHCNKWLQDIPEVMAFTSAQQMHGGVGAIYVLLKKSDEAKAKNREKFLFRHE